MILKEFYALLHVERIIMIDREDVSKVEECKLYNYDHEYFDDEYIYYQEKINGKNNLVKMRFKDRQVVWKTEGEYSVFGKQDNLLFVQGSHMSVLSDNAGELIYTLLYSSWLRDIVLFDEVFIMRDDNNIHVYNIKTGNLKQGYKINDFQIEKVKNAMYVVNYHGIFKFDISK